MKKDENSDVNQDDNGLEDKKLAHFKSPPKKNTPDTTEVGDDTPDDTTQGYAEENVIPNPDDVDEGDEDNSIPKEYHQNNDDGESDDNNDDSRNRQKQPKRTSGY